MTDQNLDVKIEYMFSIEVDTNVVRTKERAKNPLGLTEKEKQYFANIREKEKNPSKRLMSILIESADNKDKDRMYGKNIEHRYI